MLHAGAGNGLGQVAFPAGGFRTLRSLFAGQNRLNDSCLPGLASLPHLHQLQLADNLIEWAASSLSQPSSFSALQAIQPHFFCSDRWPDPENEHTFLFYLGFEARPAAALSNDSQLSLQLLPRGTSRE